MVIKNFKKMGHFCCFQLHFFQLWKAKLGKCKKVEEKWLFVPFPLIFCYNLAKNQLPNMFFLKNMKIFHFKCQKIMILGEKRPSKFNSDFNNQQILLIVGLVTASINQKIFRGQIFEFWIFFQDFGTFWLKK